MREILFRAKSMFNGKIWVYGDFVKTNYDGLQNVIYDEGGWMYEIISETIGQYTGLTDKNGTKIFEGDIVTVPLSWDGDDVMDVGKVFYSERSCGFYRTSKAFGGVFGVASGLSGIGTDEYEVIGNIYDNPEMTKGEDNG